MAAMRRPPDKPPQWAEIGLDMADRAKFGEVGKFAGREQPLSGGQRAIDAAGEFGHGSGVAGLDRLFDKQGPDRARSPR